MTNYLSSSFSVLRGLLLRPPAISSDNLVFVLHYRATTALLLIFSTLTCSVQMFGVPIICLVRGVPEKLFNTYCWIHSTFTLPYRSQGVRGIDHLEPGVGHFRNGTTEADRVYHGYYQWVGIFLLFQAASFYFPHLLWKICEGGRLKQLINGLGSVTDKQEVLKSRINGVVTYLARNNGANNCYGAKFMFCEFLNLVNVLGQLYLLELFLHYEFSSFGLDVFRMVGLDDEQRTDPMVRVFPKVTKCSFHTYGASGTIQNHDGLCILPINVINEKIVLFLWVWLLALALLSVLGCCLRIGTLISLGFRRLILHAQW